MVKVISLSEKAYGALKRRKYSGKSFSDVVLDLTEEKKKPSIMDLAGCLKDDPESVKVFESVIKDRKRIKMKDVKF